MCAAFVSRDPDDADMCCECGSKQVEDISWWLDHKHGRERRLGARPMWEGVGSLFWREGVSRLMRLLSGTVNAAWSQSQEFDY